MQIYFCYSIDKYKKHIKKVPQYTYFYSPRKGLIQEYREIYAGDNEICFTQKKFSAAMKQRNEIFEEEYCMKQNKYCFLHSTECCTLAIKYFYLNQIGLDFVSRNKNLYEKKG